MDFGGDKDIARVSGVIIPAFNAETCISETLAGLLAAVPAGRIAVVDDGSTDRTASKAEAEGVTCLRHEVNLGKGSALMTGLLWAREQGWQWALTMDADGQHSPADLPGFWRAKVGPETALVVGRREIRASSMPAHRRFSNLLTTRIISRLARQPVHDAQSGYRMYRLEAVAAAGLPRHGRFEWESQALVLFSRAGYSILPAEVATLYTANGSHMRLWADSLRFVKMCWRLAWMR